MTIEKLELEEIQVKSSVAPTMEKPLTTERMRMSPQDIMPNVKKKKKKTWGDLFNKKKLDKGFVAVLFLKNNRNAELMELKPKNGFFNIGGRTYHEQRDCIYTITKDRVPLVVVIENNLFPVGTKDWEEKTIQQKFAEFQDHVLKGIRHAELVRSDSERGPKMNPKIIIGFIIAAIIGYAMVSSFA